MGPVTTQTYDFRVNLFQFQISQISQKALEIQGDRDIAVSTDNLSYQTLFHKTLSEEIRYKITKSPIYGSLFLASKKLEENDTFTQQDVNLNHLKYKTNHPTFSKFSDRLKFVVSIENSNTFLNGNLSIEYTPNATVHGIQEVQAENVQVLEGFAFILARFIENFNLLLIFQEVVQQFLESIFRLFLIRIFHNFFNST